MNVGVVFVSTGGNKMLRALRSFRRAEPALPVHIIFNTSSNSWERNRHAYPPELFSGQLGVSVRLITNSAFVNGSFNQGIAWLRELGYSHACMFHDDVIFSSLPENQGHVSEWFPRLESDPVLHASSGITLACMEALVPSNQAGVWERHPDIWDSMDLESPELWQKLCPGGKSPLYFGSPGSDTGTQLDGWFVKYFVTEHLCTISRLGPTGFIIPISNWELVGGFDESKGIFYDMEYPVVCAYKGLGPVRAIPSVPHLHLHNQSTAFGDPATGLWSHDLQSFVAHYGKEPGQILTREYGY